MYIWPNLTFIGLYDIDLIPEFHNGRNYNVYNVFAVYIAALANVSVYISYTCRFYCQVKMRIMRNCVLSINKYVLCFPFSSIPEINMLTVVVVNVQCRGVVCL